MQFDRNHSSIKVFLLSEVKKKIVNGDIDILINPLIEKSERRDKASIKNRLQVLIRTVVPFGHRFVYDQTNIFTRTISASLTPYIVDTSTKTVF